MDENTKRAVEYCEAQAAEALENALKWTGEHGPQSAHEDFKSAGAFLAAAEALKARKA